MAVKNNSISKFLFSATIFTIAAFAASQVLAEEPNPNPVYSGSLRYAVPGSPTVTLSYAGYLIDDYLSTARQAATALNEPQSCFQGVGLLKFTELADSFHPVVCDGTYSNFCAKVAENATSVRIPWEGSYSDINTLKKRAAHPGLIEQATSLAVQHFNRFITDPEILTQCCGADDTCKEKLGSSKIIILKGIPLDVDIARWNPDRGVMELSEGDLFENASEEILDHRLLHELGHACSYTRDPATYVKGKCGKFDLSYPAKEDWENKIGKEATSCIWTGIQNEMKKAKSDQENFCEVSWYQEAWADSVFAFKLKSTSYWVDFCARGFESDYYHADVRGYAHCLLNLPSVKNSVCSNPSNQVQFEDRR